LCCQRNRQALWQCGGHEAARAQQSPAADHRPRHSLLSQVTALAAAQPARSPGHTSYPRSHTSPRAARVATGLLVRRVGCHVLHNDTMHGLHSQLAPVTRDSFVLDLDPSDRDTGAEWRNPTPACGRCCLCWAVVLVTAAYRFERHGPFPRMRMTMMAVRMRRMRRMRRRTISLRRAH
jgi:hypothetical protein